MKVHTADIVMGMLKAFPDRASTIPLVELLARKDIGKIPYIMMELFNTNEQVLATACKALTYSDAYFHLMKCGVCDALMLTLISMRNSLDVVKRCMTAIHNMSKWGGIVHIFLENRLYEQITGIMTWKDNIKSGQLQFRALGLLQTFAEAHTDHMNQMVQSGTCKVVVQVMREHQRHNQIQQRGLQVLGELSRCWIHLNDILVREGTVDAAIQAYKQVPRDVETASAVCGILRCCTTYVTEDHEPNTINEICQTLADIAMTHKENVDILGQCVRVLSYISWYQQPEAYNVVVDAMQRFPSNGTIQYYAVAYLVPQPVQPYVLELVVQSMEADKTSETLQERGCQIIRKSLNEDTHPEQYKRATRQAYRALETFPDNAQIRDVCDILVSP